MNTRDALGGPIQIGRQYRIIGADRATTWGNSWTKGMDSYIGMVVTVHLITEYGIEVKENPYNFPSHVLYPVAEEKVQQKFKVMW